MCTTSVRRVHDNEILQKVMLINIHFYKVQVGPQEKPPTYILFISVQVLSQEGNLSI